MTTPAMRSVTAVLAPPGVKVPPGERVRWKTFAEEWTIVRPVTPLAELSVALLVSRPVGGVQVEAPTSAAVVQY